MIAIVALLMLVSFIALKFKNDDKNLLGKANQVPVTPEVQAPSAADAGTQDRSVSVSDVVSSEKLAQTEPVEPVAKEDHIIGSTSEPIKLVVYSDFECAYCAKFADTVNQAKKEFGDKLAIIFRHYPLVDSHPNSLLAAEASECASDQGKFWEMHDSLFQSEKVGNLNRESIDQSVVTLKLSKKEFNECLSTSKYKEKILGQVQEAKAATVSGSPTSFINGELITGANPYEDGVRSDGSKLEGLRNKILRKLEGK